MSASFILIADYLEVVMRSGELEKATTVIFVGDVASGKSELIRKVVGLEFSSVYSPTIGIDFHSTARVLPSGSISFQLFETASQARYAVIRNHYYGSTDCYCLVVDMNGDFDQQKTFLEQERVSFKKDVPVLLVLSKTDLVTDAAKKSAVLVQVMQYKTELKAEGLELAWTELSACTGTQAAVDTFLGDIIGLRRRSVAGKKSTGQSKIRSTLHSLPAIELFSRIYRVVYFHPAFWNENNKYFMDKKMEVSIAEITANLHDPIVRKAWELAVKFNNTPTLDRVNIHLELPVKAVPVRVEGPLGVFVRSGQAAKRDAFFKAPGYGYDATQAENDNHADETMIELQNLRPVA
jgi:small GTP-binding protein